MSEFNFSANRVELSARMKILDDRADPPTPVTFEIEVTMKHDENGAPTAAKFKLVGSGIDGDGGLRKLLEITSGYAEYDRELGAYRPTLAMYCQVGAQEVGTSLDMFASKVETLEDFIRQFGRAALRKMAEAKR